jgi:hypothetical protein
LFWTALLALLLLSAVRLFFLAAGEDTSDLVISEFVAANGAGLADEDGDYPDWIELYNRGARPVSLAGWSLTDDPDQPQKWAFPEVTLDSHTYLVVFASSKGRADVTAAPALHTNFKLQQEGEFLGLYNVLDRRWMDTIPPARQFQDISYGRRGEGPDHAYFATPTPGGPNDASSAWAGFVSDVEFSVERGFFEEPFTVELTTSTPGAAIRYTMDGSQPGEGNGSIYTSPIPVNTTTVLRASAFKPGFRPAYVGTHTYLFLDDVLRQPAAPPGFPATWGTYGEEAGGFTPGAPVPADYEMDPEVVNHPRYQPLMKEALKSIPSLSIVTDKQNLDIYAHPQERGIDWERPASVELVFADGQREGFQANAGIRMHGGVGRNEYIPKHSFRLYFRGKYGATKLEYPLFPDSPVESFDTLVLRAGTHDSYAGPPGRTVRGATYTSDEWLRASQIALSGVGSHGIFVHLYLDGLYWGLYNLVERPDDGFLSSYLGGDQEEWYAINQRGVASGPDNKVAELLDLIQIENLEERYAAIEPFIDTTRFIDYLVLNWYAGTRDWPKANWYAGIRYPQGKLTYFVWDGERILSQGARIRQEEPDAAWPDTVRPIFSGLLQSPDFRMEIADRLYKHAYHEGALTDANAQARWKQINGTIELAILGELARWGDVRYDQSVTWDEWLAVQDRVLGVLEGNAAQLTELARQAGYYPDIDPPEFNQHGGLVTPEFRLTMAAPRGAIYYTTDRSDPRLPGTGAVAPTARVYSGPLVLTTTTHVKARAREGDTWSALHEATFKVVERDVALRLTEIMYNPLGEGDYEFVEIKNVGDAEVNLSGLYFEGIRFTFPGGTQPLFPGEFVVLVRSRSAFAERYPGIPIGGVYQGQLSNQGESLALRDFQGRELVALEYDDENGWPISADGRGDSLVLADPDGDPGDPGNWRASGALHGSPGRDDLQP